MNVLFHADFANSSGRANTSHFWFIRSPQQVQGVWYVTAVSMRMSTCNNVTSIVYDLYRVLYTQFMDVSGWLDFPKLNGTSGIRKARKLLCRCDPTNISSERHGAMLHRGTSPSTESTGWLVSTAPGQTHHSAISEISFLSTNPGNLYHFLCKAAWLPNKDVSPQTLLSYCKKDDSTIWSPDGASTGNNKIVFLKVGDKPTLSGEHSLCS